ncbi:MAG: carboxypeptidase-like regulatory domain-containing protein [Vicinamibacterales bacterium]
MTGRRGGRLVPALLLTALAVAFTASPGARQARVVVPSAPPPDARPASGTGAITGVVLDASTGRPLANATVQLETTPPGGKRQLFLQITTPTGRFAFIDLPASDGYLLTATKPGYLDGGHGRRDPRGPAAPLALTDGQWIGDVRVTLGRPGSIAGTVVDETGQPVVGAYVRVMPRVMLAGRAEWFIGGAARTDDRGAYRIAGLGPGRYVVTVPSVQATLAASATPPAPGASAGTSMSDLRAASAADRAVRQLVDAGDGQQLVAGRYAVPPPPGPDGRRMAYPIVFYPNVATPADATPIDLEPGESRQGIDFQLRPVATARVAGVLQGPAEAIAGQIVRLLSVGLQELGEGSEVATAVSLTDGRFTFLDVPDGRYVVEVRHAYAELAISTLGDPSTAVPVPLRFPAHRAMSMNVSAAPPGVHLAALQDDAEASFWGRQSIVVSGRDVDDVVVALTGGATLSGRIEWAPGTPTTSVSLVLEPADARRSLGVLGGRTSGGARGARGSRGIDTFEFRGLMAGEYILRLMFGGEARVESITWQGHDYAERPFDASDGHDITDVVVRLASGTSTIAGTVTEGAAPLAAGAAVIAFPADPGRWSNYGFNPAGLRSVLTTPDGRFRIDGLPAGDYLLVGVPSEEERAWLDPEYLAARAGRATPVRLDDLASTREGVMLRIVR